MIRIRGALVVLLALALTLGCGGKSPTEASGASAEEAALAVAKALQEGEPARAAAYWAYDAEARAQNPDWDSFPPGQRGQIKAKLRESKAGELQAMVSAFQAAGADLTAQVEGDVVALSGQAGPVAYVRVVSGEGGYKVSEIRLAP